MWRGGEEDVNATDSKMNEKIGGFKYIKSPTVRTQVYKYIFPDCSRCFMNIIRRSCANNDDMQER